MNFNRDYLPLWAILFVSFIIFFCFSACGDLSIGKAKLKAPALANIFLRHSVGDSIASVPADSLATAQEANRQIVLDKSPKTVLIIGDSMLEGITPRLAAYCSSSGYDLYSVIWYSSTTELYGENKLISDYIKLLSPDFIFISLGGNELFVNDIAQKRDKYVKEILSEIGSLPYLWIGPPNWREDTGINDLIRSNVIDGCFFTSNGMSFERKRDGAHPTTKSAAVWVDSIVNWMPKNSHYLLQFRQPEVASMRPNKYYLHNPGPLTKRPL